MGGKAESFVYYNPQLAPFNPFAMAYYRRQRRGRGRGRARSRGRAVARTFRRRGRTFAPGRTLLGESRSVRLKFHVSVQLVGNHTGAPESQVYLANGLTDPDSTSGGRQPRGFTQMMSFYRRYTVVGSKLSATFVPVGPPQDSTKGGLVALSLREYSAPLFRQEDILEDRNVVFRGLSTYRSATAMKLTRSYSPWKFFAMRGGVQNSVLRGCAQCDPMRPAFFHVMYVPLIPSDGSSGSVNVSIDIDYAVVFTEPIQPEMSSAPTAEVDGIALAAIVPGDGALPAVSVEEAAECRLFALSGMTD